MSDVAPDPAATPPQTARLVNLPNALTVLRLLLEDLGDGEWTGSAAHQDPDSDGTTTITGVPSDARPGEVVAAEVVGTEGVDLVAAAVVPALAPAGR